MVDRGRCRICETKDNLQLIFERESEEILRMLRSIATSPIIMNDCLPQHICLQCSDDLQNTYSFKLRYDASNAKMKNMLLSPNIGKANVTRKSANSENIHSKKDGECEESTNSGRVHGAKSKIIKDETCSRCNRRDDLKGFKDHPDDQEKFSEGSSAISGLDVNITGNIGQMASIHSTPNETSSLCSNELKMLLQSWKQEHLFNTLIAENVDINILKIIKIHHIERLLKDFKLGDQILFEYNLEQWRMGVGRKFLTSEAVERHTVTSAASTNLLDQRLQRSSPYLVPSTSSSRTSSPEPNSSRHINLSNILNRTYKGKIIAEFYEKNKRLTDEHRVALINLIVSYFEENHYHLSLKTSYRLEKAILEHFPSEKQEFYRTEKRGKIYSRYCNAKRIIKKLYPMKAFTEKESGSQKIKKFTPEPDDEFKTLRYDNVMTRYSPQSQT